MGNVRERIRGTHNLFWGPPEMAHESEHLWGQIRLRVENTIFNQIQKILIKVPTLRCIFLQSYRLALIFFLAIDLMKS